MRNGDLGIVKRVLVEKRIYYQSLTVKEKKEISFLSPNCMEGNHPKPAGLDRAASERSSSFWRVWLGRPRPDRLPRRASFLSQVGQAPQGLSSPAGPHASPPNSILWRLLSRARKDLKDLTIRKELPRKELPKVSQQKDSLSLLKERTPLAKQSISMK